ncbi:JmjC domain-containing protein [Sorangium sp. So ce1153]|uniref:JmjC domain-containing protein n=1 Tax=Sorangium sp. So ce1153 TaxID=3133333 RepID=UPI003F60607F
MDSVLAALVPPLQSDSFLKSFPDQFFVHHGPLDRLGELADIPELGDVRALVRAFNDPVSVWYPDDEALEQRTYGKLLRAPDTIDYYERGALLQFNKVERWVYALEPVLRTLERELGIPSGAATCSLFASTVGGRVLPHFDTDPAFSVQLRGSKRWWVAPQTQVEQPLHNFVCGTPASLIGAYHDGPLPEGMPADAQEIEMRPGSVLFLPRGTLHATRSHADSLAVTFDLQFSSYAQGLAQLLSAELHRSPRFRRPLLGQRARAEDLDSLLAEARRVLDRLARDPAAILEVLDPPLLPGPRRRYRRGEAAVDVRSRASGADPGWHVAVTDPRRGRAEIEVPPELVPLCRWIAAQRAPFEDRDLLANAAGLQRLDVQAIVEAFLESGALESNAAGAPALVA